jgi:hypothetical protein
VISKSKSKLNVTLTGGITTRCNICLRCVCLSGGCDNRGIWDGVYETSKSRTVAMTGRHGPADYSRHRNVDVTSRLMQSLVEARFLE